ncbi:MAG: tRNA (N6-threonylcarbamoyladenosine(37)-N6)-methyltransferase TrmO [Eubacterium sp.]
MKVIAHIYDDFPDKFGIPRQSGIVKELTGTIIFEKEYRIKEALEGIDDFSHLWLIWQFSENLRDSWSPTVRPPRLGGEKRKGVFATRSPFRPNPIGLSCVKLEEVRNTDKYGEVLIVSGIDLMNGTPIYDIKPYIAYCDSVPEALEGFAKDVKDYELTVNFDSDLLKKIPEDMQKAVIGILKQDPRPAYHNDPERLYGVKYADFDIKFKVGGNVLTVIDIVKY